MRKLFILLGLVMLQRAEAQIIPVRNYGIREGLNAGSISAVLRDSRGLLWVGTYNGVNLYDGGRFLQPAMTTKSGQIYVNQFAEDKHGQMWIATWYSGLYRYANGVFTNYLPDSLNIGSQTNSVLHVAALPDGGILCGTDRGAFVFDGRRFIPFDPGNPLLQRQITAAVCIANGDLLIGLADGIAHYRKMGKEWEYAGNFLAGKSINTLLVNGDQLWAATDKGLFHFSSVSDHLNPELLVPGSVSNLFIDAGQVVWYTGQGSGIWRQRPGQDAEHITRDNGLPSNAVNCGCTDMEGIVWLGTEYGLAKLTPAGYRFFPVAEGKEGATVIALARYGLQELWAGSYNNLFRGEAATLGQLRNEKGRPYGFIYALLADSRKRLWIGSSSGLYCQEGGVTRLVSPTLLTSISEDGDGAIWFGGQDGRVRYFENGKLHEPVFRDRVDERIAGIWRDEDGYCWVGYALSGLRKLALQKGEAADSLILAKSWSKDNGFPRLLVRSMRDDGRGHLLAGTRTGGVFVIDRKTGVTTNITREQGLSGNWVKDIATDGRNVYLATNNGLDVLDAGDYNGPVRPIRFNDDRVPVELNTVLLHADTLWLGTAKGILEYSVRGQQPDSLAPPVRLLKLAVNGQADSGFRLFTSDTQLRRLSYMQNNVSVDFAALSFRDEDRIRYRYRLEGLDTGWNAFTDRRYVNYLNLAPGSYRFLVEARNGDGLVSPEPAAIRFSIAAPFWETGWFITLCILLLLMMAYGFYRWRLHQALAIERLRARISTDLHDDTGSTLSSISILSDMAMQEAGSEPLTPMLKEIRDNSLSLLEKMDDIVWSINPRNDTLESLMLRVKRFAAQLFEARGIDYEIDIEPTIRHLRLSMDHRQNLYLIMKEAINNLVKYADAGRANIRAHYLRHHLEVEIRDDGVGFSAEAMTQGNGIINMRERAGSMGAQLDIQSAPGEGTTVVFSLKTSRP